MCMVSKSNQSISQQIYLPGAGQKVAFSAKKDSQKPQDYKTGGWEWGILEIPWAEPSSDWPSLTQSPTFCPI